jgi:hypothetical protein
MYAEFTVRIARHCNKHDEPATFYPIDAANVPDFVVYKGQQISCAANHQDNRQSTRADAQRQTV